MGKSVSGSEKVDADDARWTGEKFLVDRFHHGAKIISDEVTAITFDGISAYQLEGVIELRERFSMSTIRATHSRCNFKLVVDATKGGIMSWELN